ncbi:MAG: 50S ribosomal protein L18e [Candidatus Woesearchaeota archaeon]|jgi:large subunit ribosomal protein L18e
MNEKKANPELQHLIEKLRHTSAKEGVRIWKSIAITLAASTRKRPVVNISKINRYAQENEIIVIPGKVLASGDLDKAVQVAAYQYSADARAKIEQSKGKALTLLELIEKNPKGKDVRILG